MKILVVSESKTKEKKIIRKLSKKNSVVTCNELRQLVDGVDKYDKIVIDSGLRKFKSCFNLILVLTDMQTFIDNFNSVSGYKQAATIVYNDKWAYYAAIARNNGANNIEILIDTQIPFKKETYCRGNDDQQKISFVRL